MNFAFTPLAATLTGVLVLASVNPVSPGEPTSSSEAPLVAALAMQPRTPATTARPILGAAVEQSGGQITAPSGTGDTVTVSLPGNEQVATDEESLETDVTEGTGFTTAVDNTGSGTFRALLQIESADAPTEYKFEIDGGELVPLEDGGVSVRDGDGNLIGLFEPAWALDAEGAAVPTSYEVRGSTLVQHVRHTSSTAFPVVADPFWIPALFVMARLTAHVATRAAQRGVSQALIKQVVQNGTKTAGNKGTSIFSQGSGKNRIRVIVDNKSGDIITVTKG